MNGCIFCKIVRGEIPAERVLEDDRFLAIKDLHPKAPVHVLVLPKEHLASLDQIGQWEADRSHALLECIVAVAGKLGIRESGYRIVSNIGSDAGQEVDHLHVHVLGGERLGGF